MKRIVSNLLNSFHKLFAKHIDLNIRKNATYYEGKIGTVLSYAAFEKLSVQEASRQLKKLGYDVPSGDDVLHHLYKQKGKQKDLEKGFRKIIAGTLREARKRRLLWKPLDVAIDFNGLPWYGKLLVFIVESKHKQGTNKFIQFATLSIVVEGKRFIVDAIPVTPLTSSKKVVRELLETARKHGIKIKRVMLDRGFYDVSVVKMLKEYCTNYLMPAPRTRGVKNAIRELEKKGEYVMEYMMISTTRKTALCILFIVWDDEKERWLPFITSIPVDETNRETLAEDYRLRWGIETSYRMKNQFKAKTCSRCYPVRYVLYMLSICMYNLWVLLNILHAENKGVAPGKPTITVDSFIFEMRRMIYKIPS